MYFRWFWRRLIYTISSRYWYTDETNTYEMLSRHPYLGRSLFTLPQLVELSFLVFLIFEATWPVTSMDG